MGYLEFNEMNILGLNCSFYLFLLKNFKSFSMKIHFSYTMMLEKFSRHIIF